MADGSYSAKNTKHKKPRDAVWDFLDIECLLESRFFLPATTIFRTSGYCPTHPFNLVPFSELFQVPKMDKHVVIALWNLATNCDFA